MFRAPLDLWAFLLVTWQAKHCKTFIVKGVTRNPTATNDSTKTFSLVHQQHAKLRKQRVKWMCAWMWTQILYWRTEAFPKQHMTLLTSLFLALKERPNIRASDWWDLKGGLKAWTLTGINVSVPSRITEGVLNHLHRSFNGYDSEE